MTTSEIVNKYPELFGEPPFDPMKTLIGFGFECDKGWYPILEELFSKISEIVKKEKMTDFRVVQVKEKFGELSVYTNYGNKEIFALIEDAEQKSAVTCEKCGKPGTLNTQGWWKVLCEEHLKERTN